MALFGGKHIPFLTKIACFKPKIAFMGTKIAFLVQLFYLYQINIGIIKNNINWYTFGPFLEEMAFFGLT